MCKRSESFKWPKISASFFILFQELVIHEKIAIELCRLSTSWFLFFHNLLYNGIFICLTLETISSFRLLLFEVTSGISILIVLCFSCVILGFLLFLLLQANDYLGCVCNTGVSDFVRSMFCEHKVRNEIFIRKFWKAQSWCLWNNYVSSILILSA